MARPALFVLLLLAAGAAGFAAGAGSSDAVFPPRAAPPQEPAAPPPPEPAGGEPAAAAPAASALERPSPAAAGFIRGVVRTPLGAPVPAVTVRARKAGKETRTGPDGRYALGPLPAGAHWIEVSGEGFDFERSFGRGPARPGDEVDYTASPRESVDLRVVLPDGTEPATAAVEWGYCEGAPAADSAVWTPGSRTLRLPPGAWTLDVTAGEASEYSAVGVPLPAAEGARSVTVRLAERKGLLCRVRRAAGSVPVNLLVTGTSLKAGASADPRDRAEPFRLDFAGGREAAFMPDLPPGPWRLEAWAGRRLLATAEVDVGEGLTRIDLPVAAPARADYVLVRAEGPRGVRPDDLSLRLRRNHEGREIGCRCCRRGEQQEMPDGSILLWFPPDAAESEWCIDAECDEGPPTSVAFTRSEASEVAIRFADPAWLEVRPEGMDAAVDFEIRVSAASGGLGGTLGRNRVVRLGPLAPGPVDISVLRRGVELPCSPGDAVLTAGLNRLTVRVAVPADVVVSFDPEWQGAHVTLEGTDTEFRLWDRVQGPEVRFEAVPPGRYRLDLADDHRAGFMDLVAPAPGIVRFVPLRVDALRVAVTDPGGALARMGFSDGDLLVAVGTEPVRSLSGGWALLSLAASKEREDFTVLRRGVEKIVTVECPAFRGDLGGSISPATR